ncbi:hypothetical protein GCM10010271_29820 [Streptomyces kurssanovii]|nr:hypothetical protein GCM10010271_29820 [Streptomyces kurssanovii]
MALVGSDDSAVARRPGACGGLAGRAPARYRQQHAKGATFPSHHPVVACNIPPWAARLQGLAAGFRYPRFDIIDDGEHDHYMQVHCELRYEPEPDLDALGRFKDRPMTR